MKTKVDLTDDQKVLLLDEFNKAGADSPPSLMLLVEKCWPELKGQNIDGRSVYGRAVKEFLASRQLKAKASHEYDKKSDAITLDQKQKDFIVSMASKMRPLEIARNLFNNNSLMPLSAEFKIVNDFYRDLDPKVRLVQDQDAAKEYKPPKTRDQAIARINKFVMDGINSESITKRQESWFKSLIKFMHTHRFLMCMGDFRDEKERDLFESSFVRFVYDKPDLIEEEVDLYLNLCSDIINLRRIDREISVISEDIENLRSDPSAKIPHAIIEQLGKLYSERDNNMKRQKNTLDDLNGKRGKRMESRQRENASILSLVELWKEKEKRTLLVDLAKKRNAKVQEEKDRIKTMDDIKIEVYGLTEEEAT